MYLLTIVIFATFGVGSSRVYLGVYYPSDVVAGWCAGLVWALIWWLVPAICSIAAPSRDRAVSDVCPDKPCGATVARNAVEGAISGAKQVGLNVEEAASAAATGAIKGAGEISQQAVQQVRNAVTGVIAGVKVVVKEPFK